MAQLEFMFDFASPNAYFSYKVIPEILEKKAAKLTINPILLGGLFKLTGNQPPMIAFAEVKGKLDYEMLENRRFIEKHNLSDFSFNPHFPINTIMVMRGLIAAQKLDVESTYINAVLSAMWENEQKMDDPDRVMEIWGKAGLDAEAILTMTQSDDVKNTLKENTTSAVNRGVFGVPTFFVGTEMFFGKDRLGQVEEAL